MLMKKVVVVAKDTEALHIVDVCIMASYSGIIRLVVKRDL